MMVILMIDRACERGFIGLCAVLIHVTIQLGVIMVIVVSAYI
jgi:hypothetical protein